MSPVNVTLPSGGDNTIVEGPSTGTPTSELARGAAIGRYLVLDRVGAGGMGVVYAAYDPELDRKVAIKVLHRVGPSESAQNVARARLLREAQALAKLPHPNVVTIHDVGTFAERAWIAMEFVTGQTVTAWLRAEPRPWTAILDVLLAAGDGLAAAHAADLLHRDFKPDNVMVDADGRVRVMDFGLARGREFESTKPGEPMLSSGTVLALDVTGVGALIGTPAYMAPEQLGATGATVASDQFGYCVTLWEAIYGVRPFPGDTLHSQLAAMLDGVPQRGPRSVPAWLRRILERGLSTEPSARYPSMQALLGALRGGRRRARRRGPAIAAVAVAGIAVVAWGIGESRRRAVVAACDEGASVLAAQWPARATEIDTAIRGTGLAFADDTADRLPSWLDRFATRWSETSASTCRAAAVDASMDAAAHRRARACLDSHAATLTGLLDSLADGTPGAAQMAVAAAAGLPDPGECADTRVLETQPWSDQIDRERVDAIRTGFARANALEFSGRSESALALDDTLLTEAIALDWEPLVAEARMHKGARLALLSRLPDADATLRQAYFEALHSGADAIAVRVASRLVKTIGYQMGRHDEGLVWAQHGIAVLDRLASPSALDRATLDEATSLVYRERGSFDEARRVATEVISVRTEALGEEHPAVASALESLGNTLHLLGEDEAAIVAHTRALAIRESVLGPNHPSVAASLTNLANAVGDEKNEPLLLRALEIGEAAYGRDSFDLVPVVSNLAYTYTRSGRPEAALELYTRVVAMEERVLGPDHHEVAISHANLGSSHLELGRVDEALVHLERALDISKKRLPADHPNIAQVSYGLAAARLAVGDDVGAIELLRAAKPLFGKADREHASSCGVRLAGALRRIGRLHEAELELAEVRASEASFAVPTQRLLALADAEDARLLAARGRHEEAIERFIALLANEEAGSGLAATLRLEIALSRIAVRGQTPELVAVARGAYDGIVSAGESFVVVREAARRLEALGLLRSPER